MGNNVKIVSTADPDGTIREHLVNSIQQSEALKKKIDQERYRFYRENNKELYRILAVFALAIGTAGFMFWLLCNA